MSLGIGNLQTGPGYSIGQLHMVLSETIGLCSVRGGES